MEKNFSGQAGCRNRSMFFRRNELPTHGQAECHRRRGNDMAPGE